MQPDLSNSWLPTQAVLNHVFSLELEAEKVVKELSTELKAHEYWFGNIHHVALNNSMEARTCNEKQAITHDAMSHTTKSWKIGVLIKDDRIDVKFLIYIHIY